MQNFSNWDLIYVRKHKKCNKNKANPIQSFFLNLIISKISIENMINDIVPLFNTMEKYKLHNKEIMFRNNLYTTQCESYMRILCEHYLHEQLEANYKTRLMMTINMEKNCRNKIVVGWLSEFLFQHKIYELIILENKTRSEHLSVTRREMTESLFQIFPQKFIDAYINNAYMYATLGFMFDWKYSEKEFTILIKNFGLHVESFNKFIELWYTYKEIIEKNKIVVQYIANQINTYNLQINKIKKTFFRTTIIDDNITKTIFFHLMYITILCLYLFGENILETKLATVGHSMKEICTNTFMNVLIDSYFMKALNIKINSANRLMASKMSSVHVIKLIICSLYNIHIERTKVEDLVNTFETKINEKMYDRIVAFGKNEIPTLQTFDFISI